MSIYRTLLPGRVVVLVGAVTQLSGATIGYWRFEEGAGTSIADSSGRGNNGTLTSGAAGAGVVTDSASLRPGSGLTAEAMIDGPGWVVLGKQFGSGFNNSYSPTAPTEHISYLPMCRQASVLTADIIM